MALTKKETDSIIKNKTIRAASKRRTATKIIIIVLILALFLTGGTYGVLTFINANSNMITINESKNNEGLSLSKTESFDKPLTTLNMEGPKTMEAYTYTWLNSQDIFGYEGPHHGSSYIAYSFYLMNVNQTRSCDYTMSIEIVKNTQNTASALRIMVIEDEFDVENRPANTKIYAKSKEDGTAEYIAYDDCKEDQKGLTLEQLNAGFGYDLLEVPVTTPFLEEVYDEEDNYVGYYVMREQGKKLSHLGKKKYTIVIWLEGTDLQCVNDILGGKCKINIVFDIEKYSDDVEYYGKGE